MRFLRMPTAATSTLTLLAALLAGGTLASPAAAASTTFDYQVDPDATVYKNVPGTDVVFDATAGTKSYLRSTALTVSSLDVLKAGDNIGNTFAIRCRYADGTPLPVTEEAGVYWASNLVPPAETSLAPVLRWLFIAPGDGRYHCNISVTSYSSIIRNGREVTMRIPAGAQLLRSQYASGDSWTLPADGTRVVPRGASLTTLDRTYTPTGTGRTTVVMDAALSTCKPGSSLCSGGTTAHPGTQAQTVINVQPRHPDESPCGPLVKSTVKEWFISTAKHHQTATNSLYVENTQTAPCSDVHVSLTIKNAGGNPLNVHSGWTTGNIAATHGVAVTQP